MHKYIYFIVLFLCISCQKHEVKRLIIPSKVDSLKSIYEIQSFVRSLDSTFKEFQLKPIQKFKRCKTDLRAIEIADSLDILNTSYKIDFDNNGLTDILVMGQKYSCEKYGYACDFDSYVIMNFKEEFRTKDILRDFHLGIIVPKIQIDKGKTFLEIYEPEIDWHNTSSINFQKVKLIYKFDDFIEYNENPSNHDIEKVEYFRSPCFGSCPIFEITINQDKSSTFKASAYNFSERRTFPESGEGTFKAIINDNEYHEILDLLNYMSFEELKEDYTVAATDNPGGVIKITYDGGKKKIIHDDGLVGTRGLKLLHKVFADLRFDQKWK